MCSAVDGVGICVDVYGVVYVYVVSFTNACGVGIYIVIGL